MNPNNWSVAWSFILAATLLSVVFGWSVERGWLPLRSMMAFSDRQWQFMRIWVNVALSIGVIVPLILLIVFWSDPVLRQFWSCYLLVVAIQLGSEIGLSRTLCKSVVVIIGTLYTGFRIWQLWAGMPLLANARPWLSLMWLVLLFWIANIIMLFTLAIPSILPSRDRHQHYTS